MYLIVTDLIVDLIVELIVCSRRHTARYFKLSSAESLAGSSLPCVPWAPFAPAHVRMHALPHQPLSLIPHQCVSPRCGASCRRSADQCARDPKSLAERQAAPVKQWPGPCRPSALPCQRKCHRASALPPSQSIIETAFYLRRLPLCAR